MTPLLSLPVLQVLYRFWPWLLGRFLILRGDVRAAGENCRAVLHEKPAAVQAGLAAWPVLFGLNLLYNGDALYALAPHVYGWLHTGAFLWLHARVLGASQVFLGLWQVWALVWPILHRETAMRRAMKVLCGMNTGFLCGFALYCPHGAYWQLYLLWAAGSVWCLWRLARPTKKVCSEKSCLEKVCSEKVCLEGGSPSGVGDQADAAGSGVGGGASQHS